MTIPILANSPSGPPVIDLGKVQSEGYNKDTGLISIPFPTESDDETTEVIAFDGAEGVLTVTGLYTGVEADLKTAVTNLRALASADPNTTRYWSSNLFTNLKCNVLNVSFDYVIGAATRLPYSIKLIIGVVT